VRGAQGARGLRLAVDNDSEIADVNVGENVGENVDVEGAANEAPMMMDDEHTDGDPHE
jgi:hypothetical protein